jgi:hypothetical protein
VSDWERGILFDTKKNPRSVDSKPAESYHAAVDPATVMERAVWVV